MENEIWRECTSWLTRCGALRPDHKLNWSDSTITDFAFTLRDGVLLCNLLNILDPDLFDMKDVNQKPQMAQFLCLRNIKTFLQACQDIYGLLESDLFEPTMLFDLSDFYKVMRTLSKLSNCTRLRKKSIQGFSVPESRSASQEDIYRKLNAGEVTERKCSVGGTDVEYAAYDNHIRNEEVYHHLCSVKKRNTLLSQMPVAIIPSIEKRDYVINELIETEKNYVDVLNTLQKSFMRPLVNILPKDDFEVIFKEIKELVEIHTGFHIQLKKACTPCSTLRLSEVFLGWRQKFIVYGDYCANLTTAQARIIHCCKNDVNNQEITRCEQEANNGKFKLSDILSVPMQRILKYHLLLDKLLQETQPHHEDYRGLERAKEAMVDVAQYINDVKKDFDALNVVTAIQRNIIDWNSTEHAELKNFGRLKKDGEIKVKCANDPKNRVRYVFVFDYILLMCKSLRGDQYSCKEMLYLSDYKVEELTRRAVNREHSARWSHSFHLVHKNDANFIYTFYFRTDDAKKKWITSLQDALDNIEPASFRHTEHKFVFQTFNNPSICNYCSKFLKGRIFQGYKCGKCGIAVHKSCIANSSRCGTRYAPDIPPRPQGTATPRSPLSPNAPLCAEKEVTSQLHNHLIDVDEKNYAHDMKRRVTDVYTIKCIHSHGGHEHPPLPADWNQTWSDVDHLTEYLWFVGEMGRDQATNLLEQEVDGTFLVRVRPQGPSHTNESVFALSLKTDGKVKHMKVYEDKANGMYLSQSHFFPNLVDLVNCYEQTSLSENFMGLNVRLQWPFRRITAVAEFDFYASEPNQLQLKKGCQVLILSKEGDEKGWWKGQSGDKKGFFPKVYVREISDTFQMNSHI